MKKGKWKLVSVVAVLILAGLYYYIALPAINVHATEIWMFMLIVVVLIGAVYLAKKKPTKFEMKRLLGFKIIAGILILLIAIYLIGSLVVFANYKCKEISEIIERRDRKIYYRCRRIII